MREDIAGAVKAFDPDVAITRLFTLPELHADNMGSEVRLLRSMSVFALAAILVSAVGLYGIISYAVSQRTAEFGIRLALGARRRSVVALVLRDCLRLAGIGAIAGFAASAAAVRVIRSALYGVSPADPLTIVAVLLLVSCVAAVAAWLPARRATRVDVMASIRM